MSQKIQVQTIFGSNKCLSQYKFGPQINVIYKIKPSEKLGPIGLVKIGSVIVDILLTDKCHKDIYVASTNIP